MNTHISRERCNELAAISGAITFSPPPMRAIRGFSLTFEQLEAFANAAIQKYIDSQPDHFAGVRNMVTLEQAHDMGANGAQPTEEERLLFEAWMRGHCWALSATWDGRGYRSDAEQGGDVSPPAMRTRQLWAAWRDRAALGATPPPIENPSTREAGWKQAVMLAYGHLWHVNNEPMAPIPLRSPEKSAYEARKLLREMLTQPERGEAINQVAAILEAAKE